MWCDAYGCTGPFGANVSNWENDNPLVAPLIPDSNVANFVAIDGGVTTFTASIGHDRWGWDGLNCYYLMFTYDNTQGTVRVLEMDSISPGKGVVTDTVPVTITGKNFQPGSSLVIDGGSGVTASNVTVSSTTQITANLTIAPNATGGNRTIKVRSNNKNSNSKNFFVQVPTHLLPLNHDTLAPNGIGPLNTPVNQPLRLIDGTPFPAPFDHICGVFRHYLFFLADQDNQRIDKRPFVFGEIFTNYSGAFATPTFTPVTIGQGKMSPTFNRCSFWGRSVFSQVTTSNLISNSP